MTRTFRQVLGALAITAATMSCGDVVRDSRSPMILVIDHLLGANGASTSITFTNPVFSDVITIRTSPSPCSVTTPCPTIFADPGQVTLHLDQKNIGTPTVPAAPTTNNEVIITGYHVEYRRSDGRNTAGVDVPFAFDGGLTGTVTQTGAVTFSFELVRHVAKEESPLIQLQLSPTIINVIAYVTFYGHDTVGNSVSVTGTISIDFGNFGDS